MEFADIISHFNKYTLKLDDMISFSLFLTSFYIFYFALCRAKFHEKKKLAWCITLLNSAIMIVASVIYYIGRVKVGDRYYPFIDDVSSMLYRNDNVSVLICISFGIATLLDLIFGLIFYSEYVQLLSGWFHHTVFIWLMYFMITTDGLFISTHAPFTPIFVMSLIQELPTFILALGSIFPQYRSDLGFGFTFFILRILHHAYFFYFSWRGNAFAPIKGMYILTISMHINWFYGWITKYRKYSKPKIDNENAKKQN
jgi:hypothetical protein